MSLDEAHNDLITALRAECALLDIETLLFLSQRMQPDQIGELVQQFVRASAAKRPSKLQRVLRSMLEAKPVGGGAHD